MKIKFNPAQKFFIYFISDHKKIFVVNGKILDESCSKIAESRPILQKIKICTCG